MTHFLSAKYVKNDLRKLSIDKSSIEIEVIEESPNFKTANGYYVPLRCSSHSRCLAFEMWCRRSLEVPGCHTVKITFCLLVLARTFVLEGKRPVFI